MLLPGFKPVVIVKNPGTDNESRMAAQGAIQPERGYFAPETQIYEGDEVEIPDPPDGNTRLRVAQVHIIYGAGTGLNHLEVVWGEPSIQHTAPIRRLGLDGLHPEILKVGRAQQHMPLRRNPLLQTEQPLSHCENRNLPPCHPVLRPSAPCTK